MPTRNLLPTFSPRPLPAARGRERSTRGPRASLVALAGMGWLVLALLGTGCGGDLESRMAEVRALQDVGQFTESLEELREILAIAPDLPEANYRLGVALVQTGEPSQAVWALKKAAESPDYAVVAGLVLAQAQHELGNYEEAIRAADRVLEENPDLRMALHVRAQSFLGAQRLEEALTDTEHLIELFPSDYDVRALHVGVLMDMGRLEEAQEAAGLLEKIGAESGDPDTAARACLGPALLAKDHLKDVDRAREAFEACVAKHPNHPTVLMHTLRFFDAIGERDRSMEILREAVERSPENLALRSQLANRLRNEGKREEAEQVLQAAVESFASAAAWNALASFYRVQGEHEKALEAMEEVMELSGGGNDRLRFAHADVLIDAGELERAARVAESLNQPTYQKLVRGRIALARGDAREALSLFEEGIRRWPDNAGARYLAGLAAQQLGDYERALSEFREAVRADPDATDAALHAARLHFERGEYEQAASFASNYARQRRGDQLANALVIRARAHTALEEHDKTYEMYMYEGCNHGFHNDTTPRYDEEAP